MERFAALTPRETEVLHAVVDGRLNKQIAHQLGIAEITVKLHRSNLMKKMGAASIAELNPRLGELADGASHGAEWSAAATGFTRAVLARSC